VQLNKLVEERDRISIKEIRRELDEKQAKYDSMTHITMFSGGFLKARIGKRIRRLNEMLELKEYFGSGFERK